MTKKEFLTELKGRLATLPERERENALRYYSDFFDDAEGESEENIVRSFGSPIEVADAILKDYYTSYTRGNANNSEVFTDWYERDAKKEGDSVRKFFNSIADGIANLFKSGGVLMWILAICTIPLWLPLLLSGLAALFGVAMLIIAIGAAGVVTVLSLLFAGGVLFVTGLSSIILSPLGAMAIMVSGIVIIGVALLIAVPVILFLGLIPKIIKAFFSAFKKKEAGTVPPPRYEDYTDIKGDNHE